MSTVTGDIEALKISILERLPSQTIPGDRRSLLAVQRAVRRKHQPYTYLEIGSYLGGSLQGHVVDDRCALIYSIDPRPAELDDDRAADYVQKYEDNSTARMLELLRGIGGNTSKIRSFEMDAAEIDPRQIDPAPHIVFIDGEHTDKAVMSDFEFCRRVVRPDGVILFHDFAIVYPAIMRICRSLAAERVPHVALKLEGNVFGIFFDESLVDDDAYLSALMNSNRHYLRTWTLKRWIERAVPDALVKPIRSAYRRFAPAADFRR